MSYTVRRTAPLSRTEAISLANALRIGSPTPPPGDSSGDTGRAFLTFVMIPVEERIGEWRFAGTADTLGEAFGRLVRFALKIGMSDKSADSILQEWLEQEALEVWTDISKAWSYDALPLSDIGAHDVVLFAEGQAPYDDFGLAVLAVATLQGSPFQGREPEDSPPPEWSDAEGDMDEGMLDYD